MKIQALALAALCSLALAALLLLLPSNQPTSPPPVVSSDAQGDLDGTNQPSLPTLATVDSVFVPALVVPEHEGTPPQETEDDNGPASSLFIKTITSKYENGGVRERYDVIDQDLWCEIGAIAEYTVGKGKCIMLVWATNSAPSAGSTVPVKVLGHGATTLDAKVVVRYHVDDDPARPVEQVGIVAQISGPAATTIVPTDKRRTGLYEAWYEDGTPAARGYFDKGVESGAWTYWHHDGTVRAIGAFIEGRASGHWQVWFPSGRVWATVQKDGPDGSDDWTVWAPTGEEDVLSSTKLVESIRKVLYNAELRRTKSALEELAGMETEIARAVESSRKTTMLNHVNDLRTRLAAKTSEKLDGLGGPASTKNTINNRYPEAAAIEAGVVAGRPVLPPPILPTR